jgi:integrative and conjugative element protein (TIGR02256 family)
MEYQLFLNKEVLKVINDEIKKCPIRETGGILIGYKSDNSIVVTNAIGPGPNAKHSFFNFKRDVKYCNEKLLQYFKESKGVLTYLGEWHTHPFGRPIPSQQDDKEMYGITKTEIYQNDTPILIIGRNKKKGLVLGSFIYEKKSRKELPYTLF